MIPFCIWGGNWSHSRQIFLICLDRRTARAWLIHKTWVCTALSGWKQFEMSRCSCFSAKTTETGPVSIAFLSQWYIRSVQLKYNLVNFWLKQYSSYEFAKKWIFEVNFFLLVHIGFFCFRGISSKTFGDVDRNFAFMNFKCIWYIPGITLNNSFHLIQITSKPTVQTNSICLR